MAELEKQSGLITSAILQDKTLSTLEAAYAVFPIAAKKELAAPFKAIFDKYAKAGITSANYTSESSMVESMLGDLAAASVADSISGLEGVAEAIASVRTAQDGFTKANDDYMKASTAKSVEAEISHANGMIAKRGKKNAETAAE